VPPGLASPGFLNILCQHLEKFVPVIRDALLPVVCLVNLFPCPSGSSRDHLLGEAFLTMGGMLPGPGPWHIRFFFLAV
jgi:hypothetical protein